MPKLIKVQNSEFKGHKGVDVRVYIDDATPTKSGIWISEKEWANFVKKINAITIGM